SRRVTSTSGSPPWSATRRRSAPGWDGGSSMDEGPTDAGLTGAGRGPEALSDVVARRLLAQRVVLLRGPLDDFSVTRVAAELMTLDAEGDGPGPLPAAGGGRALAPSLTLMDVIGLMGVPVRALCLGQVAGGAIGVVAVCSDRSALPSTRFS